ncbi:Lsr2 family DNA-binding protein [Streptomyces sp. CA-288835]|uniref:Lsr2 family DNA-binding protein n=1 Tax=Streptomyces sp. CA-288835 TaxID=3240069 RepID=UPI003D8BF2D4
MNTAATDEEQLDPAVVRAWIVKRGLLMGEDDGSPVTPPEYRLYRYEMERERRLKEVAVRVEYRKHDEAAREAERSRRAWVASEAFRTQAAREWAQRNGFRVGQRGRVPAAVLVAFVEAAEKGELHLSGPEFKTGDRVSHSRFPERIGHVVSVEREKWAPEYVYSIAWGPADGRTVPYRSGLRLVGNQLGVGGAQ